MAKKQAAKKSAAKAPAAKKAPNGAKAEEKSTTGRTSETAGVGNAAHPGNNRVPESVLIKRAGAENEQGTKITESAEVQGDKALQIIDILNSRPVHVSLVEGVALLPEIDGRLVFIEGPVAYDLKSVDKARGLFAVKKDGTVIYNPRGFDEVAAGADFDLVDIVKLVEHNQKK